MDLGLLLLVWLGLSLVVGFIADARGLSLFGYLLLSMVFSPLIGGLLAIMSTPSEEAANKQKAQSGRYKRCPDCAELVQRDAKICRFCSFDFSTVIGSPAYFVRRIRELTDLAFVDQLPVEADVANELKDRIAQMTHLREDAVREMDKGKRKPLYKQFVVQAEEGIVKLKRVKAKIQKP